MGVDKKGYSKTDFEKEAYNLLSAIKKQKKGWDQLKSDLFESECKNLGFEINEKNGCIIF